MDLAGYIEHTLLKPEAEVQDIIRLCEEAIQYKFAAVCVNPAYVGLAAHHLSGTSVKTATVIGFPLGATFSAVKALEAKESVLRKANELDMVINIGALKAGLWEVVTDDIAQVVEAADGAIVKVIVETCLLTEEEKRRACETVITAGAHFIKTSTGFSHSGACLEDVKLFKQLADDRIGIKASGGIRTYQQAVEFIASGANRLGTSAGVKLVTEPNK